MLNVSHVLERNNIRTSHVIHAVADIGAKVRDSADPLYTASKLFNDILNVPVKFTDEVNARTAVKHMIRDVLTYKCIIDNDDIPDIIEQAMEYADGYCADPFNSYLWSKPDNNLNNTKNVVPVQQVVEGINLKVAVNKKGKIQKGGKAPLATEMYQKYVIDAEVPLTRKEFIALLIDKLNMTEMGASTYHYNCKKSAAQSLS